MEDKAYSAKVLVNPVASTEIQTPVVVRAGTLEELKSKGRLLGLALDRSRPASDAL
jgi:hypothetical protein